ncbi:MAG TPA: DUF2851 family protein [Ohtaekwangia sp.]|nr:DUF2851 family protein [Ohtaekwangia sp.]
MNESFLHYVWQYQYFDKSELLTTSGETLQIFNAGSRNPDAGPDFLEARLQVGGLQWIGSVEIHIDASGWYLHEHDRDESYDSVVLHVVWRNDSPVLRRDGSPMPTLELAPRVDPNLLVRFRELSTSIEEIPCSQSLRYVKPIVILNTLDRMLTHRLEERARFVKDFLVRNRGDWEETMYQLLARNFGFRLNADPFLQLARALPLKILMKHRDHPEQLEAMLFGVAGFLDDDYDDSYYLLLQREFDLLRKKYRLDHKAMNKTQWKFLRLRPANFPTLRLAQFAAFFTSHQTLLPLFLSGEETEILQVFRCRPSPYWEEHYNFRRKSTKKEATMGDDSVFNLIINTVVPVLGAYALSRDDQRLMEKAIRLLHQVPPESNHVIRKWNTYKIACADAFDSQALLELYNNFCTRHRCLDCNIGASLVKPVSS